MNTAKLFHVVLPAMVAMGLSATVALAQGAPGGNTGPGGAGSSTQPSGQTNPGSASQTNPGSASGQTNPGSASGQTNSGSTSGQTNSGSASGRTNPGSASGQTNAGSASGQTNAGSAAGSATSPSATSNYSTSNVTTADPFGDINTTNAGTTSTSVGTWARNLNDRQRAELAGRCNVITGQGNETRYRSEHVQLCRNYSTAMGPSSTSQTQTR